MSETRDQPEASATMIPIKPALLLFLLAVSAALFSIGLSADEKDPYKHFFNDTFGDFQEELTTARSEGKKAIMIFFEMDECPFCHRMKQNVLNQAEVQTFFREHFKQFAVDIEGDVEIQDFAGKPTTQKEWAFAVHRVRATPVIAFFDLDGNKIMTYTGAAKDSAEFMLMGRFIAEGHYKQTDFIRFKREQRSKPAA
ncbi:MAG: thioredoxin family protein [Thiotrichales bacterium]